ncbi:5'-nucleotidase domain-containing protein 1 isoform X3 [Mastomys coucha]|uniref:5'-nucleotidase domain-containing protein 1 isoform X3 n=1 Tax=Mastomys coucha TaxID=35658 RepID=UPI001261F676|nr:5'-nucleotidase domain-containing protein 1 isoform X3 [Mastomys coucha]
MAQHFSLAACDVVGFDLDHTLCRYNLPESARLIYNSFAQFLIKEKGYDEELLTLTPEDWDFCCKGLALDLEDGTFIKLAADGTVLRASHGTKMMTPEALTEAYGKKEWRHCVSDKRCTSDKPCASDNIPCCSGKCYFYDNYFDLPGALLCARVVDCLTKQNRGQKTFDFWKDVVAGIQHNFKMSAFKENDEEKDELPSLDRPGWYSQGNAAHLYELLKKMTSKPEPKVVYFGDSMHSDIFPAHHYTNWETVLILEELQGQEMEEPEEAGPLEKRGKYEGKPLNSLSNKWGSYFIDSVSSRGTAEESLVYTWSSKRISTYSTIAIPSIESIAELPLDYKFTRFSTNNSKTAGYYPLAHYTLGSQDTDSKIISTEK